MLLYLFAEQQHLRKEERKYKPEDSGVQGVSLILDYVRSRDRPRKSKARGVCLGYAVMNCALILYLCI